MRCHRVHALTSPSIQRPHRFARSTNQAERCRRQTRERRISEPPLIASARKKPDRAVYWERHGEKLYETRSDPRLDFTDNLDKWHLDAGGLTTRPIEA